VVLTDISVIGLFCFDENIIRSNLFLDMLEDYDFPQLSNNNVDNNNNNNNDNHFPWLLEREFPPGRLIERRGPIAWPRILLILRLWTSSFDAM
jgi:hypothetical protein